MNSLLKVSQPLQLDGISGYDCFFAMRCVAGACVPFCVWRASNTVVVRVLGARVMRSLPMHKYTCGPAWWIFDILSTTHHTPHTTIHTVHEALLEPLLIYDPRLTTLQRPTPLSDLKVHLSFLFRNVGFRRTSRNNRTVNRRAKCCCSHPQLFRKPWRRRCGLCVACILATFTVTTISARDR